MRICKRLVSFVLSATIVVSVISGCSGSNPSSTTSNLSAPGSDTVSPEASASEMEPITYRIMVRAAYPEYPPDGGEAKKKIQEAWAEDLGITNTDYEVIAVGSSDYITKLNAMMAGGDTPDFFNIEVVDLATLVQNKIIVPVDDYIATMPNYQKLLESTAARDGYDHFIADGKHYGFVDTMLEGTINGPGVNGLIMRTDWLEKLNMEPPTTLDQLHTVLAAFTNDDPDGNGQKDTYGFGGGKSQLFASVFGAYGVYMNGINSWVERDGKLVHSTVLPETKQALALLQGWYKEGLIDPDKFVIEDKQGKEKFIANKIGSFEHNIWWAHDARIAWAASQPTATCGLIQPPKGPDGKFGHPTSITTKDARVISQNAADNKDPERLVKILEWTVDRSDKGGFYLVTYGEEGKHYTYDKAKDYVDISLIDGNFANLHKLGYSNPVRWLSVTDRRWIKSDDPRAIDFTVSNDESNWLLSEFGSSVPAMKDYPDLFSKLWTEYLTKIITGALPIDAFDEYVTNFEKQGGKELTEQVNTAWAAKK